MQSRFLAASVPSVSEEYLAVADDENVRDKLLETLILFRLAPIPVREVRRGGYHVQLLLDLQAKALKHTQLFEEFPFKTKHSFFRCHTPIWHSISRWAIVKISPSGSTRS